MTELKVGGVTVSVPVEKLSEGLYNLHKKDEKKLAVLKFGMLDAGIIEEFQEEFDEQIRSKFAKTHQELFESRITDFIKRTRKEIIKGIYSYAKLVV